VRLNLLNERILLSLYHLNLGSALRLGLFEALSQVGNLLLEEAAVLFYLAGLLQNVPLQFLNLRLACLQLFFVFLSLFLSSGFSLRELSP
jgi:hypothetical protein